MLDLTGQYVIAVILALGGLIQPYSPEQITEFTKKDGLSQAQIDAYNFRNQSIASLRMLPNEELARYIRAACLRSVSSTLKQKSVDRGELLELDFEFFYSVALQDNVLDRRQQRLLPEEQNISLVSSKGFFKQACDTSVDIKELAQYDLTQALNYFDKMASELPKIQSKEDLPVLPEISRVYDQQGTFLGELTKTETDASGFVIRRNRRIVGNQPIPVKLKQALVAVEDARFWNFKDEADPGFSGHSGVDFKGMMRAAQSSGSGGSLQGASTITMQLVKNLLLYPQVANEHKQSKRSVVRKLQEYYLVAQVESVLSKGEILDWYFHTVDFGRNSQGIVMAAQSYFGKPLANLTLAEQAFLAGLPNAPNALDPMRGPKSANRALKRRNKVLKRMRSENFISDAEYKQAKAEELVVLPEIPVEVDGYNAHYLSGVMAEAEQLKKRGLVEGADLVVPINHTMQKWAVESLQRGLLRYERSVGRVLVKPKLDRLPNISEQVKEKAQELGQSEADVFAEVLATVEKPYKDFDQFELAVVLDSRRLGLVDGRVVNINSRDRQIRKRQDGGTTNLKPWDVVYVQNVDGNKRIASATALEGAVVVIDNQSGKVLASAGRFTMGAFNRYLGSKGNFAFWAERQPGSTIKPFTYLFGLKKGLSPSTQVSNLNFQLPARSAGGKEVCGQWNYYGAGEESQLSLRRALAKSRNRAAVDTFVKAAGIYDSYDMEYRSESLNFVFDELHSFYKGYGLYNRLENPCYPILLGTYEVTPKQMAGAFAGLASGNFKSPSVIDKISNDGDSGMVARRAEQIDQTMGLLNLGFNETESDRRIDNYRIHSMMQGVLKSGTAQRIKRWSDLVAGKTGTTDDNRDAWFIGFNKEITVAVWVGFPENKPIPGRAEGGKLALPIFEDFMENYYQANPHALAIPLLEEIPELQEMMVTVQLESRTGFMISPAFQQDYIYYTGRSALTSIVEEQVMEDEISNLPRYYPGSRAAGQLFFNDLTAERKAVLIDQYRQVYNYRSWDATKKFCEENQAAARKNKELRKKVKGACRYVRNNPRSAEVDALTYYLNSIGFYN